MRGFSLFLAFVFIVALVLKLESAAIAAPQSCGIAWNQASTTSSGSAAICYDAANRQVISQWEGKLYAWNGSTWTLRWTDATLDGANSICFDPNRGVCYIFGGANYDDRLWIWNGAGSGTLTLVAADTIGGRGYAAVAFDYNRDRLVIHGGYNGVQLLSSFHEWNPATGVWTNWANGPIGPLYAHDMVFDPIRGVCVLHGGFYFQNRSDTWLWNGSTWTLAATNGPARYVGNMCWDSARGRVLFHAGTQCCPESESNQTWSWNGSSWSVCTLTGPARGYTDMAYDSDRDVVVLPGGITATPSGRAWIPGTWELQLSDCGGTTVQVPSSCFATIQAAIDATPAGTARTINVLAGTYNQSFSLNGKNVVVRGAAGNTTILNGAGLTTSIATFTGSEPATAGVENLVFRNGIAGRAINPPSYNFTGGGGIFGKDSSAFIRNCRFEDCGADFGAGVYMLRCTVDVDGCVFSSNDATTDGGGMQTYACSGVVKNSTFTGNRCALSYAGSGSAFKGVGIRTAGTALALQSCTISGNPIPNAGAAVEYFENVKILPGVLRLVDTDIVSNTVGSGTVDDACGLRVLGRQLSCVLSAGSTICSNTPRNVVGPYLVEGAATVCDCEGDLSGNGQVDAADLGILLSVWGTSPSNGQGDLNHDGLVSAPDLSALLALWGPCS